MAGSFQTKLVPKLQRGISVGEPRSCNAGAIRVGDTISEYVQFWVVMLEGGYFLLRVIFPNGTSCYFNEYCLESATIYCYPVSVFATFTLPSTIAS